MKTIDEILALESEAEKIEYIMNARRTPVPNVHQLLDDWDPTRHKVMKEEYRKDSRVLKKEGFTTDRGLEVPPEYEKEPVNRISLPIEQDIVNLHTAFTVGREPNLVCEPNNPAEAELFKITKAINRKAKMRFHNKEIVRSWLAEQEVAEYWYAVKDEGFWNKVFTLVKKAIKLKSNPTHKLKSVIWSPFRGDTLYPYFDNQGDYKALGRKYRIIDSNKNEVEYFMFVTDLEVFEWRKDNDWVLIDQFKHSFVKNPTIYAYRDKPLCANIRPARERLEDLKSDFADCIKQHFFPKLILEGDLENGTPYDIGKSKMLKINNNGKAYYLDWQQTPEMVSSEMDGLFNDCYGLTNTPRISFDTLKGSGNALSGIAFEYVFLATHLAVDTHAETIGKFLQRRENFKLSAIASLAPTYKPASETIDVEIDIVPYRIEDLTDKIEKAISANGGNPVASLRTGVIMAGIVDNIDDEVEKIKEELGNQSKTKAVQPTAKP